MGEDGEDAKNPQFFVPLPFFSLLLLLITYFHFYHVKTIIKKRGGG